MKTQDSLRQFSGRPRPGIRGHRSWARPVNDGSLSGMKKVVRSILVSSLILIAALNLSGCLLAAAGAGGAVGYKVGTDERSAGTQLDDATITSKINAKLVAEPGIRTFNIDVDTLEGNVTLSGFVKSEEQIQRIVAIAKSVDGVKSVTSNLKVKEK